MSPYQPPPCPTCSADGSGLTMDTTTLDSCSYLPLGPGGFGDFRNSFTRFPPLSAPELSGSKNEAPSPHEQNITVRYEEKG
ncbi:hypothetical protein RRG08_014627 [Elysia crispata]|uniref:Uncharacterized protein n=1 Tax=Elysia crispata TaxID=231223 RepID=A0AAE0YRH7_9GAST|nr:hypothetical protein RRG08_014627 [Elysia crispata]